MIGVGHGILTGRAVAADSGEAPAAPVLTAPDDNARVFLAQDVTVSATTSDGDLDEIQWVLDPGTMDEVVVATDASDPYSTTWTVDLDTDLLGAHTLVARAVRGAHATDSAPIDIVIDEWLLSWVDPSAVLQYCRADLGVTESSGAVSAWADQSGNGKHWEQLTGTNQPTFSATGGPNSTPCVDFDGSNDWMSTALDLPAPGTTPTLVGLVACPDTWSNNDTLVASTPGSFDAGASITQQGATPETDIYNGSTVGDNAGGTLTNWHRYLALFTGANTNNRLKINSTNATGINASGNDPGATRTLGARTAGAAPFDGKFAEVWHMNRAYVSTEESDVDAYITRRHGSGLV